MQKRLSYLLILIFLLIAVACKNGTTASSSEDDEGAGGCEGDTAKAILWVDYKKERLPLPGGTIIRTVKVHAKVYADGSLKILSFCKKQSMAVENYLLKRTEVYRIRKEIFEENYLEPGEQYLQLRYIPGWMK